MAANIVDAHAADALLVFSSVDAGHSSLLIAAKQRDVSIERPDSSSV